MVLFQLSSYLWNLHRTKVFIYKTAVECHGDAFKLVFITNNVSYDEDCEIIQATVQRHMDMPKKCDCDSGFSQISHDTRENNVRLC